jgi:glycosyltransferase involved in cell wall biosynthesis
MNITEDVVAIDGNARPAIGVKPVSGGVGGIRVLHVLPSLDPRTGGVAEAVVQFMKHMRSFGCTGEAVTLDLPDSPAFDRVCGTVYGLGPGRGFYGFSARLARWMREHAENYDAIVVHGIWQFHSVAAWYAVVGKRTPLLVYPHGMLDPWFQRTYPAKHVKKQIYWSLAERWVFRRAKAIMFTCQAELDLAREPFLGDDLPLRVSGFGIEPMPLNVDTRTFWNAYPGLRGKRVLLFLSRIHEKKGCDLLIRAFARIARQDQDLRLVIAGPGDDALIARLKQEVRACGVDAQVVWTGMLSGDLKWAALCAAELFVLPSHQENFGIAIVEALASGTPVLITDRVNIWKEIAASGGGWVCTDTEDSVTDALQRWVRTSAFERDAIRGRARESYRKHFRIETAARRLAEIVAGVSGSRGSKHGRMAA